MSFQYKETEMGNNLTFFWSPFVWKSTMKKLNIRVLVLFYSNASNRGANENAIIIERAIIWLTFAIYKCILGPCDVKENKLFGRRLWSFSLMEDEP